MTFSMMAQKLSTTHTEHCLHFANSMRWHASSQPMETLHSYADLLGWAQQAGLVTEHATVRLGKAAEEQPHAAASVFERAIEMREAIYRVFSACVHGRAHSDDDLARINAELAIAQAHLSLAPAEQGFAWTWESDGARLDQFLWPLVRSTAEILTSTDLLSRVGECADDRGCGWLFVDLSKNHSRRWCDINDCGNRAKQRRYYARSRK
jgi:predicted RNA-binding Zn ribbon-like protein